jgi:drug/metabolite transporter superfamily protein YnfA
MAAQFKIQPSGVISADYHALTIGGFSLELLTNWYVITWYVNVTIFHRDPSMARAGIFRLAAHVTPSPSGRVYAAYGGVYVATALAGA